MASRPYLIGNKNNLSKKMNPGLSLPLQPLHFSSSVSLRPSAASPACLCLSLRQSGSTGCRVFGIQVGSMQVRAGWKGLCHEVRAPAWEAHAVTDSDFCCVGLGLGFAASPTAGLLLTGFVLVQTETPDAVGCLASSSPSMTKTTP